MDRITIDIHDPNTERLIPEIFSSPPLPVLPSNIFVSTPISYRKESTRFINREDPKQFAIFAGASCVQELPQYRQAGWAFCFGNHTETQKYMMMFDRLEDTPVGSSVILLTQDRADVRVLIAILQSRRWAAEGFSSLVIATSSDYVARAISEQLRTWLSYDWRRLAKWEVSDNSDLWQIFLSEVDKCSSEGLNVKIWPVAKSITQPADRVAAVM
ncbi:hypothetical protein F4805DRAFT_459626 [Annulohypoxylon moriforme]|nr:hypothetical protein F4805DRAFT_459626 [Annulohypoxylon moriforme]